MKRSVWTASAVAVLVSALAWQPRAEAQSGTSVLQGVVKGAVNKSPVDAAIVTVTSPALQVEQVAVTDSSGFYRVPNLPPGTYLLRVEHEGFLPHERAQIALRADVTFQLNVDLITEASQQEQVVIIERPPTIDLGSSSVTTTITEDMVRRVPIARPGGKGAGNRSFEAVAEAAPAAKSDQYGTSISGTTSPENRYLIDGLAVNNTAYGLGGTQLSSEFIREINVVTGGYLPEYGRSTGGILSATTKSGSNQVAGSAWSYATPGGLVGSAKQVFQEGQTVRTDPPKISLIGDLGADVGFPIIKDKLWLYTGVQVSTIRYDLGRAFYSVNVDAAGMPVKDANGDSVRTLIPGSQKTYDTIGNAIQAIGKVSFAPNSDNSLSLTTVVAPSTSGGSGEYGIDPEVGGPERDPVRDEFLDGTPVALGSVYKNTSIDNLLKWSASGWGKRVLLDTTAGWHHEVNDILPNDGSELGSGSGLAADSAVRFRRTPGLHSLTDFEEVPPGYCDPAGTAMAVRCPVTTYATSGSTNLLRHANLDRYQMRSVVSVLAQALGHHVIKLGADAELTTYDLQKGYTGGDLYRENRSGTAFADYRNFGYLTGPDQGVILTTRDTSTKSWMIGGFVQDSWALLDKVTLNLGLRYDSQYIYDSAGTLGVALPYQFGPRAGFIWDPSKVGRAKLFGSFARYYSSVPLDLADRSLSGDPQIQAIHPSSVCNPSDPAKRMGCTPNADLSNLNTQGDAFTPNQKWTTLGGGFTPVDPNLQPSSANEVVLGSEYQLLGESRVGLSYTKRWIGDIIEDMSRDEATTYFLGNPGKGIASGFPKARRDYDAFSLVFTRAFHQNWLAQASYTLSWLRGNYNGLFRPENGQLDPNITSDFDLQSLLANSSGYLPGDRRHQVKLFGARDFPLAQRHHVLFGFGGRGTSGAATDYLGSHPIYGPDVVYILPRGTGARLPWQYSADVQLGYGFSLDKARDIAVTIDVYNLFNFQAAAARDSVYTRTDVLPVEGGKTTDLDKMIKTADGGNFDPADKNPNFGRITAYQAPRIVRFGLRVNY
jgi:hypothetical protein